MKKDIQINDKIIILLDNSSNVRPFPFNKPINEWKSIKNSYNVFEVEVEIYQINKNAILVVLFDLGYFGCLSIDYGCFKLIEPIFLKCFFCEQLFQKDYFESCFVCYSCSNPVY